MSNDAKPWRRFDIDGGRTVKMPSGDYTDYAEAKATVDTLAARIAELEAQLEAARKDVEKLRALYRAMREPMAMIGMDKHIGPFSDEAIALLDAMNALDGGTYSKSEGS